MSDSHRPYALGSANSDDVSPPWLSAASPGYFSHHHQLNFPSYNHNGPERPSRTHQHHQRVMPLDLSYHQQVSNSLYQSDTYYTSPPTTSSGRRTFFDMDTGQQSYISEASIKPPACPLPITKPVQLTLNTARSALHQRGRTVQDTSTTGSTTQSAAKQLASAVKSKSPDSTGEIVLVSKNSSETDVAALSSLSSLTSKERSRHKQDSPRSVSPDVRDSQELSPTDQKSMRSRSRRPVERYQVIHDYRGKKHNFIDVTNKKTPASKPRKKPVKPQLNKEMLESLNTARKITSDLLHGICKVDKNRVVDDQATNSVMVPDSTTEPLSNSSSSTDLQQITEQVARSIFDSRSLSKIAACSAGPSLKPTSMTSPSPPKLKPSQASPTIYKALTTNLPSANNDIQIIKEVNRKPAVKPPVSTDSSPAVNDRCSKELVKTVEDEPMGRRRRVCQTDFFQIVYPQPKRRKSADAPRPTPKVKATKEHDSLTSVGGKGWRGKSSALPMAIDSTTQSSESSDTGSLANATEEMLTTSPTSTDKEKDKEKVAVEEEEVTEEGVEERSVGRIVWARLTARCKAWPAMTINASSAAQNPPAADYQWVFWYGENKVSEVLVCRLQDFDVDFKACFKQGSGALYITAVTEALRDCWMLINNKSDVLTHSDMPKDLDLLLKWAEDAFVADKSIIPQGKVTKTVGEKLAGIVDMINNAEESSDESDGDADSDFEVRRRSTTTKSSRKSDHAEKKHNKVPRATVISKVRLAEVELESICLSCGDHGRPQTKLQAHPLFNGGVCEDCLSKVKDSFFSFGADGCMSYCVICGNGGELLVCDSQTCGRTYCNLCIEVLGSEQLLENIKESDPWECFLCQPVTLDSLLIKGREDWKQRLMRFYQKPSRLHNLPECKPDRKLRVMSLFDGIGTAKVVLDNLNLDIEVYYSLEIEEDAIQVINLNHCGEVVHLGDIRSLTEEKLAELGRIDLLVGGSPCNDLALVNPARKGLYDATGTGILFFDFYRILMTLMSRQPDHSVLWLFENVVHMNKETKETISRFLECEPVKLDAGVFSAQSRSRYFWGNIPGMFCPVSPEMMSLNIRLQDVLSQGREAAVNKIRTVTTRGASLLQGKNEDMHAVVMNGQSDKLWPTELERVFGLPVHYTDAGNLAPGKRQKLLGRSWCVPVIEHLLKPLTHLFAVKEATNPPCTCGRK